MQRLYDYPSSADQYQATEAHLQVIPESICPCCFKPAKLQRHGAYDRWVVSLAGLLLRIWIARFLCSACRHTISYLPDFALTYRLAGVETFEAYLEGDHQRNDVQTLYDLLRRYRRRLDS